MTQKMLAALVKAPFEFRVQEVLIPEVKEGWVLVKVKACFWGFTLPSKRCRNLLFDNSYWTVRSRGL